MSSFQVLGIDGFPLIEEPCDLSKLITAQLRETSSKRRVQDGDLLVLSHKIISKAEGAIVDLREVTLSSRAEGIAAETGKDARLVEVILQESRSLVRVAGGHIITEHRLGFICANSGVDRSNTGSDDQAILLPRDPDGTAKRIRQTVARELGRRIAVLIADTQGRAFRVGAIGTCIGVAGMAPLLDLKGHTDLFGVPMQTTIEAIADELCAAATLVMGQCDEGIPLALIRGYPVDEDQGSFRELLMDPDRDLFR